MLQSRTMRLHPLLTYNASTQALQVHDLPLQCKDPVYMFGVVEVKLKDYLMLSLSSMSTPEQSQNAHGVYISEPLTHHSQIHGHKKVMYLVLGSNESKIAQKYHDLFASIILTVANVCLFDIGSKYLRQARQADQAHERSNYVVMSTHSFSEIYRAMLVVGASGHNKLEISGKIGSNTTDLWEELTSHCNKMQSVKLVHSTLQHVIGTRVMLANYLNFQELQCRFNSTIRLAQFMHEHSKQYVEVYDKSTMITQQQMAVLENDVHKCDKGLVKISSSVNLIQADRILQQEKKFLIQQVHTKNRNFRDKMLHELKQQFFKNVGNLGELYIKESLAYKVLQEYGIPSQYCAILYSDTFRTLQFQESQKFKAIIYQKECVIQKLSRQLAESEVQLTHNMDKISKYEQKCLDFKELYCKYTQKCTQLQRERISSLKDKAEIATLLTQQQRRSAVEQEQLNIISTLNADKQQQQSVIAGLQNQLNDKQNCILEISSKNSDYEHKISNYQNLEGEAWRCMQDLQSAKEELHRYKGLVNQLQQHFDSFKRAEIIKFNFVLRKNHEEFFKVKKDLQQKCAMIEDSNTVISRLKGELNEERARLKYCQMQAWAFTKDKNNQTFMLGEQFKLTLKDHSWIDNNDRDNDNHRRNRSVIV